METVCQNSVERCCISIKCLRMTLSFLKANLVNNNNDNNNMSSFEELRLLSIGTAFG